MRGRKREDLLDQIKALEKRISDLETVRRLSRTSLDAGELTITDGVVTVRDTNGTSALSIYIDDFTPTIVMSPTVGESSNIVGEVRTTVREPETGATTYEVATTLRETGQTDGGRLVLERSGSTLSHTPLDGNETFINVGGLASPETFLFQGKWPANYAYNTLQGVLTGGFAITGGVSSATITYDLPMQPFMIPIANLKSTGGVVAWLVTAYSNSSFTVAWTDTTDKVINYLAVRT